MGKVPYFACGPNGVYGVGVNISPGAFLAGTRSPLFSEHHRADSTGVDVQKQDAPKVPVTSSPALGYCFPPQSWRGTLCSTWRNAEHTQ